MSKQSLQTHHVYLGAGGVLAVAALVVALTFGLSGAQTQCGSGMHFDSHMNTCMPDSCPSGYTGTPPNCTAPTPPPPPPATVTCANGTQAATMDQCPRCPDGSYVPAGGLCPTTQTTSPSSTTCPSGQYWSGTACVNSTTSGTYASPPPGGCVAPTSFWNGTSCIAPLVSPSTACSTGQYWNGSACVSSTTSGTQSSPPPGGCVAPTSYWNGTSCIAPVVPPSSGCATGQYWDGTGCRPMQNMPPSCPQGQYWNGTMCASSSGVRQCAVGEVPTATNPCMMTGTTGTTQMRQCGPNEQPTAANPCSMSGTGTNMYPSGNTGTTNQYPTGSQMRQCGPNEQPTAANPCSMSGSGSNQYPTGSQMRQCGPNEYPTPQNPCMMQGGQQGMMPGQTGDHYRTGEGYRPTGDTMPYTPGEVQCGPDMQKCPDSYNPSFNVCMPKKIYYDPATHKNIEGGREATCEDFKPQSSMEGDHRGGPNYGPGPGFGPGSFGRGQGFGSGPMPFGGPMMGGPGMMGRGPGMGTGQGEPMPPANPCEYNPYDPFCKAGFNLGDLKKQHEFNVNEFDFSQIQFSNTKQEVRNLKREAKQWARDAKDVRRQLTEISRESSGFACPVAIEVDGLVAELERAVSQAESLSEKASEEEVKTALALRDHINGRYDQESGQMSMGIRSKLFGGPMDEETGEPIPGKTMGLHVCREISGMIYGACEASKRVEQELKELKEGKAPEVVLKTYAEVLPKLQERCSNPLGALQKAGVSFDELAKPWMPDPEVCNIGGGFGGPFGGGTFHGGPFDGGFERGHGGPGGRGGDFVPPPFEDFGGDFSPEMMKRMMEKYKEFSGGEGMPHGFSPFGASVIAAHPFVDQDEDGKNDIGGDHEDFPDFEGEEGEGMYEMPAECMPPVQRYLGFDQLMRPLMEARFAGQRHFESMNACEMFQMAEKEFARFQKRGARGGDFGPPEGVEDLIKAGLNACEASDSEAIEAIREEMLSMGRRGPGRGGRKSAFAELVDVDKLIEEKLAEKLKGLNLLEEGDDEKSGTVKELQAKLDATEKALSALTAKLDEAQKAIFALNEQLADMATKVASAVKLSDTGAEALGNISELQNKEVQQEVAGAISELADKADAVKAVLPAAADKLIDQTLNSLIQSPPSEGVLDDIKNSLTAIQSYAVSGATEKEILEKVKDEVAEVAVFNASDVANKVETGIVGYKDTADLSQWYAVPALTCRENGFCAAPADLPKGYQPGEPENIASAAVRVARLLEKVGEVEQIDLKNTELLRPVEGAPDWAKPFIRVLQEEGIELPGKPSEVADRIDIAVLVHDALEQSLGSKLPEPENFSEYLTPDTKDLPEDQREAVATIRYLGIMDTTDGSHFSPDADFNRAQNAIVTNQAYEALQSVLGEGAASTGTARTSAQE